MKTAIIFPDQSIMGDKEKLSLYSEIDAELRLSSHPNVAEFVGICEDKGFLKAITLLMFIIYNLDK